MKPLEIGYSCNKTDLRVVSLETVRLWHMAGKNSATKICDAEITQGREFSSLYFGNRASPRTLGHPVFSKV